MNEQNPWSNIDQKLEAELGKDILTELASVSGTVFQAMKMRLLDIIDKPGSSGQHREELQVELKLWRDFAHGLFARTQSANMKDPAKVEAVIKAANAILAVEPLPAGDAAVEAMIKQIEKRYGGWLIPEILDKKNRKRNK